MRRERKSLRIGVHHAYAIVWEPVYRTHLIRAEAAERSRDAAPSHAHEPVVADDALERVLPGAHPRGRAAARPRPLVARLRDVAARRHRERRVAVDSAQGRSIQSDGGVELKGVSWS